VTADIPDLSAMEDPREIAEELLRRAATIAVVLGKEEQEYGTTVLIAQALATAGLGYAKLAEIDAATELATEPDLIIDVLGSNWHAEPDQPGMYANGEDPAKEFPAAYIRSGWGPTREYVLRPPRPAG
jgi:hypothetical protein